MEVIIKGTSNEIAALIPAVQGRQMNTEGYSPKVKVQGDAAKIAELLVQMTEEQLSLIYHEAGQEKIALKYMVCPACGKARHHKDALFCSECGQKLEQDATSD